MAAERKEQTKEMEQPKSAPLNRSRSPHTNDDASPRSVPLTLIFILPYL